jgi:hypothetical protein
MSYSFHIAAKECANKYNRKRDEHNLQAKEQINRADEDFLKIRVNSSREEPQSLKNKRSSSSFKP